MLMLFCLLFCSVSVVFMSLICVSVNGKFLYRCCVCMLYFLDSSLMLLCKLSSCLNSVCVLLLCFCIWYICMS